MNSSVEIYLGAPIEVASERAFLAQFCADLKALGHRGLVLANLLIAGRQIDFLTVLDEVVCHIELKNLTAPVSGGVNGGWQLHLPDGTCQRLDRENPYRQ